MKYRTWYIVPILAITILAVTFLVSACGGRGGLPNTPASTTETWQENNDVRVTLYRGHPLWCVELAANLEFAGGCDFVQYHHDYGWNNR